MVILSIHAWQFACRISKADLPQKENLTCKLNQKIFFFKKWGVLGMEGVRMMMIII